MIGLTKTLPKFPPRFEPVDSRGVTASQAQKLRCNFGHNDGYVSCGRFTDGVKFYFFCATCAST